MQLCLEIFTRIILQIYRNYSAFSAQKKIKIPGLGGHYVLIRVHMYLFLHETYALFVKNRDSYGWSTN